MVGIKDYSKKAGGSISSGCSAMNGSSKLTEETRTRVQTIDQ